MRSLKFQSTHPHGVRRQENMRLREKILISIHAPAWGATSRYDAFRCPSGYFNPRTRMGCDAQTERKISNLRISIHAPAWGATDCLIGFLLLFSDFNPRTRMGCDGTDQYMAFTSPDFNPRTRMGCDFVFVGKVVSCARFQSTHPHGVRPMRAKNPAAKSTISIHAPAWGATAFAASAPGIRPFISIHAPAWGATRRG